MLDFVLNILLKKENLDGIGGGRILEKKKIEFLGLFTL